MINVLNSCCIMAVHDLFVGGSSSRMERHLSAVVCSRHVQRHHIKCTPPAMTCRKYCVMWHVQNKMPSQVCLGLDNLFKPLSQCTEELIAQGKAQHANWKISVACLQQLQVKQIVKYIEGSEDVPCGVG